MKKSAILLGVGVKMDFRLLYEINPASTHK